MKCLSLFKCECGVTYTMIGQMDSFYKEGTCLVPCWYLSITMLPYRQMPIKDS